ncbi:MAG: nucleoside-diphosphate kinase, partial [Bacteroidales bacterium]
MPQEHTLTIIKPHAVRDQKAGSILAILNDAGFRI